MSINKQPRFSDSYWPPATIYYQYLQNESKYFVFIDLILDT